MFSKNVENFFIIEIPFLLKVYPLPVLKEVVQENGRNFVLVNRIITFVNKEAEKEVIKNIYGNIEVIDFLEKKILGLFQQVPY